MTRGDTRQQWRHLRCIGRRARRTAGGSDSGAGTRAERAHFTRLDSLPPHAESPYAVLDPQRPSGKDRPTRHRWSADSRHTESPYHRFPQDQLGSRAVCDARSTRLCFFPEHHSRLVRVAQYLQLLSRTALHEDGLRLPHRQPHPRRDPGRPVRLLAPGDGHPGRAVLRFADRLLLRQFPARHRPPGPVA